MPVCTYYHREDGLLREYYNATGRLHRIGSPARVFDPKKNPDGEKAEWYENGRLLKREYNTAYSRDGLKEVQKRTKASYRRVFDPTLHPMGLKELHVDVSGLEVETFEPTLHPDHLAEERTFHPNAPHKISIRTFSRHREWVLTETTSQYYTVRKFDAERHPHSLEEEHIPRPPFSFMNCWGQRMYRDHPDGLEREMTDTRGRLHSAKGPAKIYADGRREFYVCGTLCHPTGTALVVLRPDKVTTPDAHEYQVWLKDGELVRFAPTEGRAIFSTWDLGLDHSDGVTFTRYKYGFTTPQMLVATFGAARERRRARKPEKKGPWQLTVLQKLPRVALAELMDQIQMPRDEERVVFVRDD